MRLKLGLLGSLCVLCLAAPGAYGATLATYESPEEQVSVLELFTSHGCSSCPPADAWLRTLSDRPGLWRDFFPVAFHVDYWNDLGWPDRFASTTFSERQRDYARKGHLSSVYTPGFVLRGDEWKGWFRGRAPEWASQEIVGKLSLDLHDDARAVIRFAPRPPAEARRLTAHLAILGFGVATNIGAGENRGRTLEEDFVVLGYAASAQAASSPQWELALPKVVPAETTRRAIVAWVSVDADPTPWQAVGGWLPSVGH